MSEKEKDKSNNESNNPVEDLVDKFFDFLFKDTLNGIFKGVKQLNNSDLVEYMHWLSEEKTKELHSEDIKSYTSKSDKINKINQELDKKGMNKEEKKELIEKTSNAIEKEIKNKPIDEIKKNKNEIVKNSTNDIVKNLSESVSKNLGIKKNEKKVNKKLEVFSDTKSVDSKRNNILPQKQKQNTKNRNI